MPMIPDVLVLGLSNALLAALLLFLVLAVRRFVRNPAALHVLWLAVLARLLAPPLVTFGVLAAHGPRSGTASATHALIPLMAAPATAPAGISWPVRLALGIWLPGTVVVVGLFVLRTRRFLRTLRTARPVGPAMEHRVRDLAATLGCRSVPKTLIVDGASSPQLWGGLRRTLLILPENLVARLQPAQLDTIILHELVHLRRRDHLVRWLELLATAVYWWHPGTWLAIRGLRESEEAFCDATVVRLFPERRHDYAMALVESVRANALGKHRGVATTCFARTVPLERRITTMFQQSDIAPPMTRRARLALATFVLVALGLTPLLKARQAPAPTATQAEPIALHVKDADLNDILGVFAKLTNTDILIEPGISGTVTLDVENEPWDQVLERIVDQCGATFSRDDGHIIVRARTPEPRTQTAPANTDPSGADPQAEPPRPRKLRAPAPEYPEEAVKAGAEGAVILKCLIGADGKVHDIEVLRPASHGLTEAAVDAVRTWEFEPVLRGDTPIPVTTNIVVKFVLDDGMKPHAAEKH